MRKKAIHPVSERRDVLILGVKGSGKTVFLTVLGHEYDQPRGYGLNLVPDEATKEFVAEGWQRMSPDDGSGQDFPETTNPQLAARELCWTVQRYAEPLFRMRTLECGGETMVKAFKEGSEPAGGGGGKKSAEMDPYGQQKTEEQRTIEKLRKMADEAALVCLFLNPRDFEDGKRALTARYRRKMDGQPPSLAAKWASTLEEAQEQLSTNHDGARNLAETFLRNQRYTGTPLLFVLTQTGPDADGNDNLRAGIRAAGNAMEFLLGQEKWLAREAVLEGREVGAVAVSAVENVEEDAAVEADAPLKERPKGIIHSRGLEDFMLMMAGGASADLARAKRARRAYFAAEAAHAAALPSDGGARLAWAPLKLRLDASKAWAEAGREWKASLTALERSSRRKAWKGSLRMVTAWHERNGDEQSVRMTKEWGEGEWRRAERARWADWALWQRAKRLASAGEGAGTEADWLEEANRLLREKGFDEYRIGQLWPDEKWLGEAVETARRYRGWRGPAWRAWEMVTDAMATGWDSVVAAMARHEGCRKMLWLALGGVLLIVVLLCCF